MDIRHPIIQKARIGLYSAGLKAYWSQFSGLRERLIAYGKFIESRLACDCEVFNFGLVDDEQSGREAGEWLNSQNVDLVFCHSATYFTSASVLPVHQICKAPVVVLNLQPTPQMNYPQTTTGEWLAVCVACPVPEIANAFNRAGISYHVVNGLLGLPAPVCVSAPDEVTAERPEAIRAWREIRQWAAAASIKRTLTHSRFGFLGNNYSGMLDMYSDFTMIQAQTGIHVELLEMCDLDRCLKAVQPADVERMRKKVLEFFQISGDSPSDPIARKPTEEQLEWSCRVAAAQERMVAEYRLNALSYYYHGADGNAYEQLQSGFIVGHSLLTAAGVPCAGEGDLKTALAMKICDTLGTGGSFCEIVAADYNEGTIIMGHDGPFHISIASEKPILRGMGIYHGKRGSGVSVEAYVRPGPVTALGVTQTREGRLRMIVSEGEAIKRPILTIGNTQTHIRWNTDPDNYMDKWFMLAPTHHFALAVGHQQDLFLKTAELLGMECFTV